MIKKILIIISIIFSTFTWFSYTFASRINIDNGSNNTTNNDTSSTNNWWCWKDEIELNTDIPWIWSGGCIKKKDATDTFGNLMWSLMKIALNITVAVAFIALIASWVMISLSWANQSTAWKWKELIKKVVLWIVLIWLSWLILNTINPNFFKTSLTLQIIKNTN